MKFAVGLQYGKVKVIDYSLYKTYQQTRDEAIIGLTDVRVIIASDGHDAITRYLHGD